MITIDYNPDGCQRLEGQSVGLKLRPVRQCVNPTLPGTSLCAHHLGEAAADFRRLTQDASAEAGDAN